MNLWGGAVTCGRKEVEKRVVTEVPSTGIQKQFFCSERAPLVGYEF